ncbi:cytochrome c5 [Legionella lansingensis]|uniref:Cytochrome c5 n=1 Tax=Legionella lansingensis TaxID=45067 RepID=A0A0W0VPJ9_9GAMM|nr:c-type cytochrome [Legionella lansingensis]KTD22059.1 cytochrome c5 [Legionella lansingensis]SNV54192.1 cytochrome c5 [Legionella lansingensis]
MHFRVLALLFFAAASLYASEDFDRQQIEQRIKPIGRVNIEGQKTSVPSSTPPKEETQTVAQTAKDEPPGKATYERYCSVCHRDGVAGAPKFRDAAQWKSRLDAKKLAGLTTTAIKGLNAMPPKGTCMDCSDEEIKNAVQYMLPQS